MRVTLSTVAVVVAVAPLVVWAQMTADPSVTSVSECHVQGTAQSCLVKADEHHAVIANTPAGTIPTAYSSCHGHGTEIDCNAAFSHAVQVSEEERDQDQEAGVGIVQTSIQIITSASQCHMHGDAQLCMTVSRDHQACVTATSREAFATAPSCHNAVNGIICEAVDDNKQEIVVENIKEEFVQEDGIAQGGGEDSRHSFTELRRRTDTDRAGSAGSCDRVKDEYNISLRVGLIFVILATGAVGVFLPIFVSQFTRVRSNLALVLFKQFGTGVIIATAFVHLFTDAVMTFDNKCLGTLDFDGTAAAILMAGLFLSFLVDYLGRRFLLWHEHRNRHRNVQPALESGGTPDSKGRTPSPATMVYSHGHGHAHAAPTFSKTTLSVLVLEAGIIFHSVIIGLTLVVSGDNQGGFLTLFTVIIFHQMFEGLALGSCIAALPTPNSSFDSSDSDSPDELSSIRKPVSLVQKLLMATAFAFTTPIGMAIGIGVVKRFNDNNPATIVAIGMLDALSAGILVWVGVVEMWAADWMSADGELANAGVLKTCWAFAAMLAGMALMSLLGKWA